MVTRTLMTLMLASAAGLASAQSTPVGAWHTVDDATKEVKSLVVITESNGTLQGRVEKLLRKEADLNAVCDKCTDDRKGKKILGMEIIRGARKADGKDVWEGGNVLDPENGAVYSARLTPIEGGRKLEMRGYLGLPMLGRTQTWIRVAQ
ncbi:MAG: DUF2147 domain-containing protein [Gammaproteobacteria bacterium]|nr:DUF2147 domain-containing protein [Gammaproteobacteria bacterium]MBU0788346.1 DUF2147 domain-containing protein [Gammaproteobacteria bacterium]MBU0815157.1 DUF2147 domain-containing protein [Gammaproteobacteria bacterium]MBU1785735.1 DUF2147 domain-containing protein [Gammaproteobacteria bacterium]